MRKVNKLKIVLTCLVMYFAFTTKSFANANLKIDCNKTVIKIINRESSSCVIVNSDLNYNDLLMKGKFWDALRDMWEGFKDSMQDKPMPIAPGGNSEDDEELILHIEKFAKNNVRNKDNAYRILYEMEKLIESDRGKVSKYDILNIISPKSSGRPQPRWLKELLDDIFKVASKKPIVGKNDHSIRPNRRLSKKGVIRYKPNNDDEPLPKLKINWKRVGWIIGEIVKRL